MDNLVDSEYEKIGKEVYSQLTVYESYGHIGMSAALFLMVACGIVIIVYSLIIIGIKTHRWSIQTFVLVELILVYTILMPITLLHPYVILVTNQYVLLSMSILQKYSFVQMCILGYYLSFIYAFATAIALIAANFIHLKWQKGSTRPLPMSTRIILGMLNIPLALIGMGAFGCFSQFAQTPGQAGMPPGFAIVDISTKLFVVVTSGFCLVVILFFIYSYWVHRQVEKVLSMSPLEEKSAELFNLEIQIFFGAFYGVFPFLIFISSFLTGHTTSRIYISEFVTFFNAVIPIMSCFLALSAHKSLHWPKFIGICRKRNSPSSQWALPRRSSMSR